MHRIIIVIALLLSSSAWAMELSDLVGEYEGPSGCTLEIVDVPEYGELGIIFRAEEKGHAAGFFLSENDFLSDQVLGFKNKKVGEEKGFIKYRADLAIFLDKNMQPVHIIYKVWRVVWGRWVPGTTKEYECYGLESVDLF